MALFLLDSDAVIDWINEFLPSKALIDELVDRDEVLATCDVVLTEVYAGLGVEDEERSRSFLDSLLYLQTPRSAAEQAGRWRFANARRGFSFSAYDMLVAAIAAAHNATVVTGNVRDYPMADVSLLRLPR